jgi:hypothetical protein
MLGKNNSVVFIFARCLDSSPNCDFSRAKEVLDEKRAAFDVEDSYAKPVPGVPPAMLGKIFRGLHISQGPCHGEFRFSFGKSSVNISGPPNCAGADANFKVSTVGDYRMWWTSSSTVVKTLWRLDGGAVTEFLNLATSLGGGPAPKDFDSGMLVNEFILAGCPDPEPDSPQTCIFK